MRFKTDYDLLVQQVQDFAAQDPFYVPLLANASALLFDALDSVNWAGFYLVNGGRLVVGPFQGKPACIHISFDRGVCGAAYSQDRIQLVDDVHAFPGHIACDSASQSEIVIPLHKSKGEAACREIFGVLDIDSPVPARFSQADAEGLQQFACVLEQSIVLL